jgi:acyl-CoA synthetase (AMP-forming)/AMP-acid ligase II
MVSQLKSHHNLYELIFRYALTRPNACALQNADGTGTVTFAELVAAIENERKNLQKMNLYQKKVLILTKPNHHLIISLCGLMSEGAIPVFLDPQLGRKKISRILQILKPDFISLDPHYLWLLFLWPQLIFKHNLFPKNLDFSSEINLKKFSAQPLESEDISFITVTSGSTGAHKIVPITFENFVARQEIAHRYLPPASPDVHHSGYVISCLQNLTEGATTILTYEQKNSWCVHSNTTRISGPPGLIYNWVCRQQIQSKIFDQVQSVLLGGAPISRWLLRKIKEVCPRSSINVIYGSTEAEPISKASYAEIESAQDFGYFVGLPVSEVQICVEPLTEQLYFPRLPLGKVGELCVTGQNVVKKYFLSDSEEKANKVLLQDGQIWHRTGDLVIQNPKGELSLVGRKKDLIYWNHKSIPNLAIEMEIENQLRACRVACLVRDNFFSCFLEQAGQPLTQTDIECVKAVLHAWGITSGSICILAKIPVDPRHHWKIQRHQLFQTKVDQKFEIGTRQFHPQPEL